MIIEYINTILNSVGLFSILSISDISSMLLGSAEWWNILNPQLLFSIFAYFGCAYAFYFISCIMPFRLFKRLFKVDNKRGR